MKVVSLIASATEMVCALGLEKSLVGRSHECDFPPTVKELPVCTEPRLDIAAKSAKIDRDVKSLLRKAVSIYKVDVARLKKLKPDVILTQSQCRVCAVSVEDVECALGKWIGKKPRVLSLESNSLSDFFRDVAAAGEALGAPARGRRLARELKERMLAVTLKAKELRPKPAVACVEWIEPLMAAGNWMPELVAMAGGINLFGEVGAHSPWMAWKDLRERDPDVILVIPCGFDLERTRKEMGPLTRRRGWKALKAVKTSRVYLADGNAYFNRPGPRLAESLEILAEILHPKAFHFGHERAGWERL